MGSQPTDLELESQLVRDQLSYERLRAVEQRFLAQQPDDHSMT